MTVFFDSTGSAWVTCQPDEPNATAFGPTGTARPVTDDEAAWLHLTGEDTHLAAADAQRRVERAGADHAFDWLPDGALRLKIGKVLPWISGSTEGVYWPGRVRSLIWEDLQAPVDDDDEFDPAGP
ncbi:MAG: hypothetical protein KGS10_04120 [Chloroflexi bacterium]|nr:hypothetical protein [Chloroflexota bacterium]